MKPRDRVIAALEHREPDRVPTGENQMDGALAEQILGHATLYNAGWRELQGLWDGKRDQIAADYGTAHVDLVRALEWDYVRVPLVPAAGAYQRPEMTGPYSWRDEQGREGTCNPEVGNVVVQHYFADMSVHDLPDPDEEFTVDPSELEAIRHVVEELGDTHFIVGRSSLDGTFPWDVTVGMEEFLVRMVTEPEFVRRAIDVHVNRSLVCFRAMLDAGVDAVMTTADYSDNRGPLMGVERFHEFIVPALARQCEAIHEMGGYFIKHTDGNVWEILDSFAEIGIDGWHGIQPAIGMDLRPLKERCGDRLCFFGGVDCETLIEGSSDQVRQEVRHAIRHAAPGGGLVVATSNVVPPGTRLENYLAMRQATRDYGRYPIAPTLQ